MMLATVIDTKELAQTVLAALVAGIGVTAIYSLTVFAASRFADFRRDERPLAAGAAGALMFLAGAASLAAIAFGIIVMTQK